MINIEKMITIGAGRMGTLIAGGEAVSLRQTEFFAEVLNGRELVLLATRQEAGLAWLKTNSDLLADKVVISLMAFVSFEALKKAVGNNTVRFVRIMTDTSLQNISWSDDGYLSSIQREAVEFKLGQLGTTEYLGVRTDEQLLTETIKACHLGWLAQALDELASCVDQKVLNKVIEQYRSGLKFADIARAVATPKGATEAGINATCGRFSTALTEIFRMQEEAGLAKARQKSDYYKYIS